MQGVPAVIMSSIVLGEVCDWADAVSAKIHKECGLVLCRCCGEADFFRRQGYAIRLNIVRDSAQQQLGLLIVE